VRKEIETDRERIKVSGEVDPQVLETRRLLSGEGEESATDWLELSNQERMQRLERLSLTKMLEILSLPAEAEDLKLVAIQKDLVMALTSQQIWVGD
jgi:hypothetical protein